MDFVDITTENIDTYFPTDDRWLADDLRRGRFLGVAALDKGNNAGQMAYTIRREEEGEGCFGVLYYLSGDDAVMEALLNAYFERCAGFDVRRTVVETSLKEAADFLSAHGFAMEEGESIVLTFPLKQLKGSPALQTKLPSTVCALSDISPLEVRYFLQTYSEKLNTIPFYDIESTPIGRYDPDLSCVSLAKDGIDAAFLLHYVKEEKTIYAELLAGVSKDATKKLPFLLVFSATAGLRKYPPDTKVCIYRRSRRIASLVKLLLDDVKSEQAWHGVMEMNAPAAENR